MKIRKLSELGVEEFRKFLRRLSSGQECNFPHYLLTDVAYSDAVSPDIEIERNRQFKSRYELGEYLVSILEGVDMQPYMGDCGFWTWLAVFWFDQICPRKNGKFKPVKDYNYILSPRYNHRPRHAIYMTWQLVQRYGIDSQFMLCKDPTTRGEITEQLLGRQDLLSSEAAIRLASALYFDPVQGTFKKGAAARKSPGCISRYIAWLQQVQLTFDIYSMSKEELAALLPKEFDRYRPDHMPATELLPV